ncbi:MAG: preprotein translocase subunit SecE [Ruminococcaceae bacterium]|nr:preprotein translocase subunit SecE [Oscillospiraceae bacterium]
MAEVKKENWFKRAGHGIAKYFRELKSELKKVVWPTWSQVMKNALTVVLCVVIVGAFIWAFDVVAKFGVEALLKLGNLLG